VRMAAAPAPISAVTAKRSPPVSPPAVLMRMASTAFSDTGRGNRTRAAQLLGLSRETLRYRIEKYNLKAPTTEMDC